MTTTAERTDLAPADLEAPLSVCYFCHHNEPEWAIRYNDCAHSHLACSRCQERIEQRQAVADSAIPPRPYASRHLCCGAKIWRASWVQL
jgi:hypothetical protein